MKSTGIVRKVDELGRIVLPIELRRSLGIGTKDMLEIFVEGNSVILRKFESNCLFCGSSRELSAYKDRMICAKCLKELREI